MKIKPLLEKYVSRETVSYLVFGVLTTAVAWGIYYGLRALDTDYKWAKILSWIGAVLFAYFTNKRYVFRSMDYHLRIVVPEFLRFIAGRLFTGFLEFGLLWLSVDVLRMDDRVMNLLITVLVVVLNYVFSKLFIFRKEPSVHDEKTDL